MSRVLARSSATSSVSKAIQSQIDNTNRFNHIGSVVKILSIFVSMKQKNNMKLFWAKCRQINNYKKKRQALISSFLNGLFIRKNKNNLIYVIKKLQYHKDSEIRRQIQQSETKKNLFKTKSAALIGIIFKKFYFKKMKNVFGTLNKQSKLKFLLYNYKIRHFVRIFKNIETSKLQMGLNSLKNKKIEYLKLKHCLKRLQKIVSSKKQYNISSAFCKLQIYSVNKEQNQTKVQKTVSNPQNSIVKPVVQRTNTKQSERVQPQSQTNEQQVKRKQLEDKNKKIELQIKNIRQSNQKVIEEYKKQVNQLEAEHERLKFNSGILDEAIQDLEGQIINRQKKSRKGMSNAELWQRIYSNFLLLLNQYAGQVLPKEKVLQSLESPLVPLNIDIDTIKAQNEVLTDLLSEYRKFYQGTPIPEIKQEELVPYDILVAKNKFLYAAVETLIRQGLGTQEEIKQLESDLESVTKQNP